MHGAVVDTLVTLANVPAEVLGPGLALLVLETNAWYVYKPGDTTSTVTGEIIASLNATGRWFKCNNKLNYLNQTGTVDYNTTVALDYTNYDVLKLTLGGDVTINFTNLRNGCFTLIIYRNGAGNNIIGWDNRVEFEGADYDFSTAGANITSVLRFVVMDANIYCIDTKEY